MSGRDYIFYPFLIVLLSLSSSKPLSTFQNDNQSEICQVLLKTFICKILCVLLWSLLSQILWIPLVFWSWLEETLTKIMAGWRLAFRNSWVPTITLKSLLAIQKLILCAFMSASFLQQPIWQNMSLLGSFSFPKILSIPGTCWSLLRWTFDSVMCAPKGVFRIICTMLLGFQSTKKDASYLLHICLRPSEDVYFLCFLSQSSEICFILTQIVKMVSDVQSYRALRCNPKMATKMCPPPPLRYFLNPRIWGLMSGHLWHAFWIYTLPPRATWLCASNIWPKLPTMSLMCFSLLAPPLEHFEILLSLGWLKSLWSNAICLLSKRAKNVRDRLMFSIFTFLMYPNYQNWVRCGSCFLPNTWGDTTMRLCSARSFSSSVFEMDLCCLSLQ